MYNLFKNRHIFVIELQFMCHFYVYIYIASAAITFKFTLQALCRHNVYPTSDADIANITVTQSSVALCKIDTNNI